jgi:hypothetical protein
MSNVYANLSSLIVDGNCAEFMAFLHHNHPLFGRAAGLCFESVR